ncbi:hypothetical protein D918_01462 [Trichuris suis]|nr:hypothetical protein D918_01462 [Trichuris suis]
MEGGHGGIDVSYEGNEPHRWNGHHGSNGGYGNGGAHGCKGAYPSKGVYGCNGGHGAHGSNGAYGGSDEYNGNGDHANNGGYEGGADGGCKDESGRVLRFGETYRKGNFIFKCERLSSIAVSLTPIKCILDEQDMRIGEKRRRGGFLYACLKTETGITIDVVGCFGDDDALAEFGETFTVKNFIFMCAKEGNAGIHKPYGCLIEGKQVKMGQTVQVRSFLYKCSPTRDGSVQTEVVACVDKSGRKIDIGKRYRDGPFLYQCKKTESGVRAALIGCVAKVSGFDQEFTFGESWNTDANSPLSYKMKCVGDESRAMVDITHCVANLEYAKTATPVGSHVELPKNMVHVCRRQADGQVLNRVVSCEEFEKNERQFFCRNIRS